MRTNKVKQAKCQKCMIKANLIAKYWIYWVLLGGVNANKNELILINLSN